MPGLANRVEVRLNFVTARRQQRPNQVLCLVCRRNARQPTRARSSENSHEHGFGLIIQRMCRGDFICLSLLDNTGKPLVAQVPCSRLKTDLVRKRVRRDIIRAGMKLKLERGCQIFHELLVGVGLGAANLVMEVDDREHDAKGLSQFQEDAEKGYGIRASRARDRHAVSWPEQPLLVDMLEHFFHHRDLKRPLPLWNSLVVYVQKAAFQLPGKEAAPPRHVGKVVILFTPMKVIVIIPAAGLGTRMAPVGKKGVPSKQFFEINGTPIVFHTLRVFARNQQISRIVVALRKNEMERFRRQLEKETLGGKVEIVEGGEHRQESVANALSQIKASPDDIVLVHDAVRPFVDDEVIANVIHEVEKHGAAIAGLPAVDTIKQVERAAEGAIVTSTIPRERIVQAQTPQGFRYELIKRAFDSAAADGFTGTDEASLVERLGESVWVVMGSARNIKITTPADMELAEFLIGLTTKEHEAE
jgi:2-C-methyl-D-erythritol 4-phosphate cytidylyltransferase